MNEYLIAHGKTGGFGRFRTDEMLDCHRGERVVVRSQRGVELGTVLCLATPRHQTFLHESPVGELLRLATSGDEEQAQKLQALEQELFGAARSLIRERQLPVEILDVEILFDARQAVLQYLGFGACELDSMVDTLAERHRMLIKVEDLATATSEPEDEEHGGCGQPGCGRADGGGCSSCGSGGCSSCGTGGPDMRQYFAHLRQKMEQDQHRVPLV